MSLDLDRLRSLSAKLSGVVRHTRPVRDSLAASLRGAVVTVVSTAVASLLATTPAQAQPTPGGGGPTTGGAGSTGSGSTGSGSSGSTSSGTGVSTGSSSGSRTSTSTSTGSSGNSRYGSSDSYLPSSSRMSTDASRSSDGFDLLPSSGGGETVRGNANGVGVFENTGNRNSTFHTVKRGDTLWDISSYYLRNPYYWPRLWSYNQQIQNPHWIYPGDRVRVRRDSAEETPTSSAGRPRSVAPQSVFLRDQGYVDDAKRDAWGKVSGSAEDKMLLSEGDLIYLEFEKDHEPTIGQEVQIYKPVRSVSEKSKGSVVQIIGTVKISQYDKDKHLARGTITESLDAIERGAIVGPVGRKFDVVPPAKNNNDLAAQVLVSIQPVTIYGRDVVVFIDKGSDDGLVAGNRLFIVRKGDPWRGSLSGSGDLSDKSPKNTPAASNVQTDTVRGTERDKDYPDEIIGELRVLRTRENTSTCIVTSSKREISSGDYAIARKGY